MFFVGRQTSPSSVHSASYTPFFCGQMLSQTGTHAVAGPASVQQEFPLLSQRVSGGAGGHASGLHLDSCASERVDCLLLRYCFSSSSSVAPSKSVSDLQSGRHASSLQPLVGIGGRPLLTQNVESPEQSPLSRVVS